MTGEADGSADTQSSTSLETYRDVVDAIPAAVLAFDPDGHVETANDRAAAVLGRPVEDLVGESVTELPVSGDDEPITGAFEQILAGDPAEGDGNGGENAAQAGEGLTGRVAPGSPGDPAVTLGVTTDPETGERRRYELELRPSPPGGPVRTVVGILRDHSERRRRERELDQYRTVVETIADPVYTTDAKGRITFANAAFEALTGYSGSALADGEVHFSDLTTEADVESLLAAIRELRASDRRRDYRVVEIDGITSDGQRSPYEARIALLPTDDDTFAGTAGVLRDVSDRNRRREVLSVVNRALRHNLRTKVNTIAGYADVLAEEVPEADLDYVERIEGATEWLLGLGEALRTLQRAVEQERRDERIPDGARFVRDVAREFREEHPDATIDTHLETDAGLAAGPTLQYALAQLVENAIVHNDADRPRVRLYLTTASKDGWVDIHVEDDGPGIPESERKPVLGEESITQLQHGSGIGLWISNWIVTVFDGELAIEDNDPEGTVVTVRVRRLDARRGGRQ